MIGLSINICTENPSHQTSGVADRKTPDLTMSPQHWKEYQAKVAPAAAGHGDAPEDNIIVTSA